jgi:hypothetical protein
VHRDIVVPESACCAGGAPACRFEIERGKPARAAGSAGVQDGSRPATASA